ncbi:serine/threonine protein kinase, partial [Verrucomicrobiales bacterium]|nr:serine/threonine protein kinase [Verrucomicrobiales bacterium]
MISILRFALASVLAFGLSAAHADWTQFRGPNAQGISDEKVPTEWSASEGLAWTLELPGEGSSCPIIFGDAIFVTAWSGEGDSILRHLIRVDL